MMNWVVIYYPLLSGPSQSPAFTTEAEAIAWAVALPFGTPYHLARVQGPVLAPHHGLRLGKTPARPNAIKFKLNSFLPGTRPVYPASFGHEEYPIPITWGMLGNDRYGVCVVAGAMHETMLLNKIGGKTVHFTTADCLGDFTAITGEQPGPNNGADMQKAASYRLKTGLRDATGVRHKIGAYVEIQAGNVQELLTAVYLFGMAGIGFAVYASAMDDFNNHRAWGHSRNSGSFLGYHYVPIVALRSNLVAVSWGRFQAMRTSFFVQNCDECVAYVSQEQLIGGKSPEGFDYAGLRTRLAQL